MNQGGDRISATVRQTSVKCLVSLKGDVWEAGRTILQAGSTT